MDTNLILTLLGIAIGVVGIIYTFKSRNVLKLIFLQINVTPLFESLVQKFKDLDISYKSVPITGGLVHLKGSLINIGNIDIDSKMIYKPLTIFLPENHKWIEVNIIYNQEQEKVPYQIIENSLTINWDLLKPNEFITINALLTTSINFKKPLNLKYKFAHRIKNLQKVKVIESVNPQEKIKSWMLMLCGIFFVIIGYFLYPFQEYEYTSTIVFDGKKIPVTIKYAKPNMRTVVSIDSNFQDTIPLSLLSSKYKYEKKYTNWYSGKLDVAGIIYFSILCILLIWLIVQFYLQRNTSQLIKQVESNV